jgi:hypothetical protein
MKNQRLIFKALGKDCSEALPEQLTDNICLMQPYKTFLCIVKPISSQHSAMQRYVQTSQTQ